jgi:hypothetical protein
MQSLDALFRAARFVSQAQSDESAGRASEILILTLFAPLGVLTD